MQNEICSAPKTLVSMLEKMGSLDKMVQGMDDRIKLLEAGVMKIFPCPFVRH